MQPDVGPRIQTPNIRPRIEKAASRDEIDDSRKNEKKGTRPSN